MNTTEARRTKATAELLLEVQAIDMEVAGLLRRLLVLMQEHWNLLREAQATNDERG
jgi:hypothetical protein